VHFPGLFSFLPFVLCVCFFGSICIYYDSLRFALLWVFLLLLCYERKRDFISIQVFLIVIVVTRYVVFTGNPFQTLNTQYIFSCVSRQTHLELATWYVLIFDEEKKYTGAVVEWGKRGRCQERE